jgi:hypothetical protein
MNEQLALAAAPGYDNVTLVPSLRPWWRCRRVEHDSLASRKHLRPFD